MSTTLSEDTTKTDVNTDISTGGSSAGNSVGSGPSPAGGNTGNTVMTSQPQGGIISDVIDGVLDGMDFAFVDLLDPPMAKKIADTVLFQVNLNIALMNATRPKDDKLPTFKTMQSLLVVRAILHTGELKLLRSPDSKEGWLIVNHYEPNGKFSGIVELINKASDENPIATACYNLLYANPKASIVSNTLKAIYNAVTNPMRANQYVVLEGWSHMLVPCNNGVYDGRDRTFTAWDDPQYTAKYGHIAFTAKLDTDYNPLAMKPAFFDPDAFIKSLFDNTPKGCASVRVVWQLIQFSVRRWSGGEGWIVFLNNVSDRAAGHNGKSTLMEMIAFIIEHASVHAYKQAGQSAYHFANGRRVLTVPIDKWADKFALGSDIRSAWMLYSDEITGANFIESTGVLKDLARRQPIQYEAKYANPFNYVFPGVLMHAQNEYLSLATKDDASFTHQIHLSFEQDFTGGALDKNIKQKYIVSKECAEYVLRKALEMDFAEDYAEEDIALLEPNVEDVRRYNVPTFRFCDEVLPGFRLPKLPTKVAYDLYQSWCEAEGITQPLTLQKFQRDIMAWVKKNSDKFDFLARPAYLTSAEIDAAANNTHVAMLEYSSSRRDAVGGFGVAKLNALGRWMSNGKLSRDALVNRQFRQFIVFKNYGTNP